MTLVGLPGWPSQVDLLPLEFRRVLALPNSFVFASLPHMFMLGIRVSILGDGVYQFADGNWMSHEALGGPRGIAISSFTDPEGDVCGSAELKKASDKRIARLRRAEVQCTTYARLQSPQAISRKSINALGNEMSGEVAATFRLVVEGSPRKVRLMIRDELYGITREALRKSFHHSQARHIEAEIIYGDRAFLRRVHDDGQGIRPTSWNKAALVTTDCLECGNVPNKLAANW